MPEPWLRGALSAALEVAFPDGEEFELSLAVTGDEAVRGLNRDYRGLDEVTDVLSFSPVHSGQWEGEAPHFPEGLEYHDPNQLEPGTHYIEDGEEPDFVYPPGETSQLGDVIISFPQARRQAAQRKQPLDLEMALLIVHGVLHLAGNDHIEAAEAATMQSKEQAALKMIPRLEIGDSITESTSFSTSSSSKTSASPTAHLDGSTQPRTLSK